MIYSRLKARVHRVHTISHKVAGTCKMRQDLFEWAGCLINLSDGNVVKTA